MSIVISFVGHSGAGKTTLIEKLVRHLSGNHRVSTIKHAHHKVELDTPGKDSHRYKAAGAAMSLLLTKDALQLVADAKEGRNPEALASRYIPIQTSCWPKDFPMRRVRRSRCCAAPATGRRAARSRTD